MVVRADPERSLIVGHLQKIRALALRTSLINQLQIRGKVALRIVHATIKYIAALCLPHGDVAPILRALRLQQLLLDVLALGISAAANELPILPMTLEQRLAALRTALFELYRWLLLHFLVQLADRFARRIIV